jgi:hypothetical protein
MKKCSPLVLLVALGCLLVAAPAAQSTDIHSPKAQISTKNALKVQASKLKCKKGYKKAKRHGKWKCVKKKTAYVPPLAPFPLTEPEVKSRVEEKALQYCVVDFWQDCTASGSRVEGGSLACSSKSLYSWSCYGGVHRRDSIGTDHRCDFREVVERDGIGGIKSHLDTTFGDSGWHCYVYP